MYYLRSRKMVEQKPFCFEVYHRRRLWRVEGQVVGTETLKRGPLQGEAKVIEARFRRLGGGKAGGKPHSIKVWLSKNTQQLPLKLTSTLGLGEIEVDLSRYRISKASK